MSRVLFISDTHFGHKNICKYRERFTSVNEHNEFVFDGICTNVKKDDTLWLLGDTVFGQEEVHYVERIRQYVGFLNLVLGNHCTQNQASQDVLRRLMDIADNVHAMVKKHDAWIVHYPLHPDELRGKICIHGHVHGSTIPDDRYVNVCCENVNYKPISFQEIKAGWRGYD